MDKNVQGYLTRYERMKSDRLTYDSLWQSVADYMLPKRDFTVMRTEGQRRDINIFDSTGIHAVEQLAGGLHGMLTPPAGKWFFMRLAGAKSEPFEVRRWLDETSNWLFDLFNSNESGFATAAFEYYLDLVAFGNAAMSATFKDGRIVFNTENLRNCYIAEDETGRINIIYLCRKMKPVEMIRRFGEDRVHENVKKAYKEGHNITFEVLQAIEPRDEHYGRGAIKEKKPFKSCFVDVTNKKLMLEEGFDDFPFMYARWSKRSGEVYGYGPGPAALAEVKQLNRMVEVMIRAATKNADPPILSPVEGIVMPYRVDPASVIYYNPDIGEPKFWNNNFQPNYFDNEIEKKRELVRKMFYTDWMNLPMLSRMTTVEINQRSQDALRQLSPMLSRAGSEFLARLIDRVIALALDNNLIPRPPAAAQGRNVSIEFTSPIAIAQRSVNANLVVQGLTLGAQLAQVDPTAIMSLNAEAIYRDQLLNTFAFPVKYLRTEEEVKEMREQQANAQEVAQNAAVAESVSKSAKNVSDAMAGGMIG